MGECVAVNRFSLWIAALIISVLPGDAEAQATSNDVIISLVRANVGDEAILALIAQEACGYDISVERIGTLKKAGVSGRVIVAMVRKCGSINSSNETTSDPDHAGLLKPGVFIAGAEGKFEEWLPIVPAIVAAGQGVGNGSLLFPNTSKLTLPGKSSRFRLSRHRPVFRIIVGAGIGLDAAAHGSVVVPGYEGLRLVRFDVKGSKRVLKVASFLNGATLSGVDQNRNVPFLVSQNSRTIYDVLVQEGLAPGQYALMTAYGDKSYRLFDFSVE